MWKPADCEGFYQLLPDLTAKLSMKNSTRRIASRSPLLDTTACQEYHPFGGDFNRSPGTVISAVSRLSSCDSTSAHICGAAGGLRGRAVALLWDLGFVIEAPWWAVAALVAMAAIAEKQSVRIGPNTEMSVAALPILFAAVAYDPLVAMIVGGGSVLVVLGRPYTRWVVWTASRSLAGAAAGLAAFAVLDGREAFGWLLLAVVAAALAEGICDMLLNSSDRRDQR